MKQLITKLTKNNFRCFQCRLIFSQKDGDWVNWSHMQVHLCRGCDQLTKNQPERTPGQARRI